MRKHILFIGEIKSNPKLALGRCTEKITSAIKITANKGIIILLPNSIPLSMPL